MGVAGVFDVPREGVSVSGAGGELSPETADITNEITEVTPASPFGSWPQAIRSLYGKELETRLYREQHFLFVLGFATCLMSLALDYVIYPAMVAEGAIWRVLTVAPLTLIGMIAADRRQTAIMTFCLAACPIAFVGMIVHFSFHLPSELAAIYLTATTIVIGLANVTMPLSLRQLVLFDIAFVAVVMLVIAASPLGALSDRADYLVLLILVACATLPLAYRFERLHQRNFLLTLRAQAAAHELRAANRRLRRLSESDPLTGILNRRGFENSLDRQIVTAAKDAHRRTSKGRMALMMIDIDHFKHFNDTHGHQSGDTCLTMVAKALNDVFAEVDGGVGRYGGEEFIGAFRERYPGHAADFAADVRAMIAALLVPIGPYSSTKARSLVTASIGVGLGQAIRQNTSQDDAAHIRETLIEMADAALYSAKRAGRNRVEIVEMGDERDAARA